MGDGSTQLVTKASNDFANKLYQKVSKTPGNVLVCPLSLHVALALVQQGAGGKTASELATVLGIKSDVKEGYKTVLSNIQFENNILKVATKLFPALNYQLNKDYVNIAQNYFLSDVENVDYSNPAAAAGKINKYVEEKTNNKIHDLISPDVITDLTRLIIINAVHFQATWKKTFAASYVDEFRITPSERVKTQMMTLTDNFQYKEDPNLAAKVLKMDYDNGDYSMVFVLPNSETGLAAVEAKLTSISLENLLDGLSDAKVEVIIPKFKLEQTLNLKETLMTMGLNDVFSSRADLRNIASGENLYVSDVIQKTFINVHENGTEAAAATVFLETLSASTDDAVFFARRPFHFLLIRSQAPSMVLFQGRFVRPISEDLPEDSDSIHFTSEEDKNTVVTDEHQKPNVNPQIPANQGSTQPQRKPSNTINQPQPPQQGNIFNSAQPPQQGNIFNSAQPSQHGHTNNPPQPPQHMNTNNPPQPPQHANTNNPVQTPQHVITNNPVQPPHREHNNPSQPPPQQVNPDRSSFGNPSPNGDNFYNYQYQYSQSNQHVWSQSSPGQFQTQEQYNAWQEHLRREAEKQLQIQQQQQKQILEQQQQFQQKLIQQQKQQQQQVYKNQPTYG